MSFLKGLLTAAGATVGVFAIIKLVNAYQTNKAGNLLGVDLKYKIHKLSAAGLEIWVNPTLKNPSNIDIDITQPYVEIIDKDKSVYASSTASATKFTLTPGSNVPLETVKLIIKPIDLVTFLLKINYKFPDTATTLFAKISWLASQAITVVATMGLAVRYSTYANDFYYSSTTPITSA
jgi:hypothetical protein